MVPYPDLKLQESAEQVQQLVSFPTSRAIKGRMESVHSHALRHGSMNVHATESKWTF